MHGLKFQVHRFLVSCLFFSVLFAVWPHAHSHADTAIQKLKEGVVKITSTLGGKRRIGTGIIVRLDPDAVYIVTASHVIEGDPHPKVSFFSNPNRPVPSKVIGLEGGDQRGLGALLVEGSIPEDLHPILFNESLRVSGGETVTLIGFPSVAGTAWAVTHGTIAGSSGRDLSFTAPADEGNSGGPLLMEGQVIGIITEVAGPFAHATPAMIAKFALESWGVKFPKESIAEDASSVRASHPSLPQEEPVHTSVSPTTLNLTGTWRNMGNPAITYSFEQEDKVVTMEELTSNIFGSVITATGEGQLRGKTLTLSYITALQTGGKAVMTIGDDGNTMSGMFTDLVTGATLPLSLARVVD